MRYKIVKENKPTLATYGKYKARAVHDQTIGTRIIEDEAASRLGVSPSIVTSVRIALAEVISQHLRRGDKVRLEDWGLMKLEIESEKVTDVSDFRERKHIRGVRLHFLPESSKGSPDLYKDLTFEKAK